MTRIVIAFLFLALAASWSSSIPVQAADQRAIARAVTRGRDYLKTQQTQQGTWNTMGRMLGETALVGLALLETGETPDSKVIQNAAEQVRALSPANGSTYEVTLAILFLDRLGESRDRALIRNLGERLSQGQCGDGSWSYGVPRDEESPVRRIRAAGGDNSNTQFAALGSWVARRHEVNMDATLRQVDQYFRGSIDANQGGWGYHRSGGSTPAMTCAGLIALATHQGTQPQLRANREGRPRNGAANGQAGDAGVRPAPRNDPVVKDALAYLARILQQDQAAGRGALASDLYFCWSLERVGMIYGLQRIGDVDWYDWGAEQIVGMQGADGSWQTRYRGGVDTSFALLFLSKSNVAKDLTSVFSGQANLSSGDSIESLKNRVANARNRQMAGDAVAGVQAARSEKEQLALIQELRDAKGAANSDALAELIGTLSGDLRRAAQQALAERFERMTPRTLAAKLLAEDAETRTAAAKAAARKQARELVPNLIECLIDQDETVANTAHAALRELTKQDFGPTDTDSVVERFVAKKRWQTWWESQ
ncbi:MAG: hypothetical protein KDA71_22315 [Planctomycetales bacterium]|nr:hypothetical protein [Planctomycetales bacterium]